jgi:DNA repair exonuclease SbcCD ATPase subunit
MMEESGSKRTLLIAAGMAAGIVGLGVAQFYSISNLNALQTKLEKVETELQSEQAKAKDAEAEMSKVRDAARGDAAEREKALVALREEVDKARLQARNIAGQVKTEALRSVQDLSTRVKANEQKLKDTNSEVSAELSGIKDAANSTNTQIATVSTDLRDVRSDLEGTRGALNGALADLKRMNGDLGLMSGLIATNGKEIDALRQLGDRNYNEFAVPKSKNPVRVGDVWVLLKKADTGRNRYTIELRADDRKIEKKDRTVNEPVQFYVGRNRQPHELVVNQVQKNQIVGYLATPKVASAR